MDILLVLGVITPEHYQVVIDAMVVDGFASPILVVNIPDYDSLDSIASQAVKNLETSPFDPESPEWEAVLESEMHEVLQGVVDTGFGSHAFSDVRVILHEETPKDCYDNWEDRWTWLKEQLPDNLAQYIMHIGDDGEPWLFGSGLPSIDTSVNPIFAELYADDEVDAHNS